MFDPAIPVWLGMICKLFSTISADVMGRAGRGMCRRQGRRVKGGLKSGNRGTRPGMASQVEGVLMAFCLVFVFETVVAELASVLLLHLMGSVPPCEVSQGVTNTKGMWTEKWRDKAGAYRNSSSLSNFLGFLGQHSHIH